MATERTISEIEADIERRRAEMARLTMEQNERYLSGLRPGDRLKIESHAALLAACKMLTGMAFRDPSRKHPSPDDDYSVSSAAIEDVRAAIALAEGRKGTA